MTFDTRITRLLGIDYPILQGGMRWAARAELAIAVGRAGGMGFLSAHTLATPAELAAEIDGRCADQTIAYPADLSDPAEQRAFAGRLKALAGESGFDVICDPVGGPYAEIFDLTHGVDALKMLAERRAVGKVIVRC